MAKEKYIHFPIPSIEVNGKVVHGESRGQLVDLVNYIPENQDNTFNPLQNIDERAYAELIAKNTVQKGEA